MDEAELPHQPLPGLSMEKAAEFRALFFEEATELLQNAEVALQRSGAGAGDGETIGELFRIIHSIKGGAEAFGMRRIVTFAHTLESALEELRRGAYALDDIRRHMLFRCFDMTQSLLQAEITGLPPAAGGEADLIKALEGLTGLAVAIRSGVAPAVPPPPIVTPRAITNPSIRIEVANVDRLAALARELIQLEMAVRQQAQGLDKAASDRSGLLQGMAQLEARLEELSEIIRHAQAQPLETVLQRLPHLVRELAERLGKQAILVISGGEIEVDKSIAEHLTELLTHILRNAVDHGLEAAALRRAAGKPALGKIKLEGCRIGHRLRVVISDDGAGLNIVALQAAAERLGINTGGGGDLSDLIFYPGLSTAASVSDISGRGVGLDVVRHKLLAIGGEVSVSSVPGKGTCFILSFPLMAPDVPTATMPADDGCLPPDEAQATHRALKLPRGR